MEGDRALNEIVIDMFGVGRVVKSGRGTIFMMLVDEERVVKWERGTGMMAVIGLICYDTFGSDGRFWYVGLPVCP